MSIQNIVDKREVQSMQYKLHDNEILKIKNLRLQRQLHESELRNIILQEQLIINQVSARVGEDISNWKFDMQNGRVVRPQPHKVEDNNDMDKKDQQEEPTSSSG